MSSYVYDSSLSWSDYLQAKSFVDDISTSSREAGRRVSMEISRQTREVIASNESLAREKIQMMEANTDRITSGLADIDSTLNAGFDRLSYHLQDISSGISELNASFHWGFSQLIAGIGHMNDALSELIKIAKTPVQTVAFNHFEIARDAFRKGLLQESLEELDKAIQGDHTSPGYKLEWRFHNLVGVIRLGDIEHHERALMDLTKAEESFLLAARYAKTDYPDDAARAFLSAGWAAYCQGKMKEALAHTEQALLLHPELGEALFQAAKVRMALGEVDKALPALGKAIDLDRFYALKAAGDGDFQKHDDRLREFLEAIRKEKYRQSVPKVEAALEKIKFWREHIADAKNNPFALRMEAFLKEGSSWPLMDMLAVVQPLDTSIVECLTSGTGIVITIVIGSISHTGQEPYQEEETYQEEVLIKPGGIFRKPVTEMKTQTRMVTKLRKLTRNLEAIRDEIYSGKGKLITSIDFCKIPAGQFMMDENGRQREVTITTDFYLGKYPLTQAQWQAVMGNNPSYFKGDLNLPVENVSWDDCQQFLKKLNDMIGKKLFRLPSEAEWEYACRAGSTGKFCFGDEERKLREYAWYADNSGIKTHPVGQLKPNAWGLYDMHGNVGECCDEGDNDISKTIRVLRGGSFHDHPNYMHCAYRGIFVSSYRVFNVGFRCAQDIR
ncbi:MAG: hypothetical protein ILNGONEN_01260 [Syntrophorhabdaceae bacterium]|nr:hypothetical protein [Syntrophorhabdaceae bacterium]